jgi:hypothetical protein
MSDSDARGWATLAILIVGGLLYLLVHVWVPTQVAIGPLRLGDAAGDCHGITGADNTVYVELCK